MLCLCAIQRGLRLNLNKYNYRFSVCRGDACSSAGEFRRMSTHMHFASATKLLHLLSRWIKQADVSVAHRWKNVRVHSMLSHPASQYIHRYSGTAPEPQVRSSSIRLHPRVFYSWIASLNLNEPRIIRSGWEMCMLACKTKDWSIDCKIKACTVWNQLEVVCTSFHNRTPTQLDKLNSYLCFILMF